MKFYTFFILNIIISICITLITYDISRPPITLFVEFDSLKHLRKYYKNKSIFQSAFYTSFIHSIVIILTMLTYYIIFNNIIPKKAKQLSYFILTGIPISFIMFYITKSLTIFSDLKDFYSHVNPGVVGVLRFITTSTFSYMFQKYTLPLV